MNLKLLRPAIEHQEMIVDMMLEWSATGERIVPAAIRFHDYLDYDAYLEHFHLEIEGPLPEGKVRSTTFFAYDVDRERMVGAINIRHELNAELLHSGGHIGDGIRPSERNKGYATQMIGLALDFCRERGIHSVLMTCDASNKASARTIQKNGGIFHSDFINEIDVLEERYWIDLT